LSFLLPCFRYRCRPSLLLLCCRGSFQASSCRRPCLLVCLFGCFQCRQLPPALCLLPGFQAAGLLCFRSCCRGAFQASSCRRGYAAGGQASFSAAGMLPGFQLPPIRSRRRIYFYKFNLFLCCRGIFFFWDPVKLPGIKALYQTIYNYNIYKTIQDHFSSCLFLLPGQKIPLVIFLLLGTPYFQGFRGYRQNIFEFFSKKGLTNNTQCCIV